MTVIQKLLRAAYLRALLHGTSRAPETMTQEEQDAALAPLTAHMEHDERTLAAVIEQAQAHALSRMRRVLHAAPGVDHEMLDQAIDYATTERGGWIER